MLRRCYVVAKLSRALDESEVAVSIDFAPTTAYRLNDEGAHVDGHRRRAE
jgi:hypothetical protein